MEPDNNNSEAKRWLSTAVKLLNFRDLHGTRGFAIRALESDPRLEGAEQIIALAEVLIAGSSRIGDDQQLCDYYTVLQVPRHTQNLELIASQYRRFALLLSPNVNRLSFADEAFNLVSEAWVVLSNHSKKVLYDNELNICYSRLGFGSPSGLTHQLHHHEPPQPPQQQQQNHFPFLQPQPQPQLPPQLHQQSQLPPQLHQQSQLPPQLHQQSQPQLQLHQQSQPQLPLQLHPQSQSQSQPQLQLHQQLQLHPQAPLNSQQPQQEHHHQQHQEQEQMRRSPRRTHEEERPNLNNVAESTQQVRQTTRVSEQEPTRVYETPPTRASPVVGLGLRLGEGEASSEIGPSFWTACPYCYILYEYPHGYEECALLCQSCKRAFQAVMMQSPPVTDNGDVYFCSWGFFPLGFSGNAKDLGDSSSNWMPFTPICACPLQPKAKKGRSSPKFIYNDDDDDIFVEISEESDDSDEDWGRGKKRAKNSRTRGSSARVAKRMPAVTKNGGTDEVPDGVSKMISAGAGVGTGASGVAAKKKGKAKWGRLDLNVEFSNEGEEPAPGTSGGIVRRNRDEDNIEGIGFFEGLDEFLSSLPILNAVGDDKAKAS